MNEEILKELKTVVEQAVRPVRATIARKRRMREELLAHLSAIFEEEVETLGDDQAALNQTRRRFGNPRELSGQLQQAVPWWNLFTRLGDWGQRRPDETLVWFAARIAIQSLIMFAAAMLLFMPVAYIFGRPNEFALRVYIVFCMAIVNIPLTMGILLLTDGMYRALYREEGVRAWRLAAVYALFSLAFFPVLAFAWCLSLTGNLAMSFAHLRLALCLAPLSPFLFALLARQAAESWRHYEEWANLKIDE